MARAGAARSGRTAPRSPELAARVREIAPRRYNEIWSYGAATQALLEGVVRMRNEVLSPHLSPHLPTSPHISPYLEGVVRMRNEVLRPHPRGHARSPEIARDHARSPEVTRNHPRSREITRDHPTPGAAAVHPRARRKRLRARRADHAPARLRVPRRQSLPRRGRPVHARAKVPRRARDGPRRHRPDGRLPQGRQLAARRRRRPRLRRADAQGGGASLDTVLARRPSFSRSHSLLPIQVAAPLDTILAFGREAPASKGPLAAA